MADLSSLAEIMSVDHGLCVFSTSPGDGSVKSSVVNAAVLRNPLTDGPLVGLVAVGGSRNLHNLCADPRATIVAKADWQWTAFEGSARLIGPDDPYPDVDNERLRVLTREERRTTVLISPTRVCSDPA